MDKLVRALNLQFINDSVTQRMATESPCMLVACHLIFFHKNDRAWESDDVNLTI